MTGDEAMAVVVPCRKCGKKVEIPVTALENAQDHGCPSCGAVHYLKTGKSGPACAAASAAVRELARVL